MDSRERALWGTTHNQQPWACDLRFPDRPGDRLFSCRQKQGLWYPGQTNEAFVKRTVSSCRFPRAGICSRREMRH